MYSVRLYNVKIYIYYLSIILNEKEDKIIYIYITSIYNIK